MASRVVSDGAWTWYNDPRARVRNGALYLGWIRSNGDVTVSKIVLSTGARTVFTLSAALEIDDHDNPALAFTPAGKLAALYCKHASGSLRMRVASNVEDVTAWAAEQTLPGTAGMTYANPEVLPSESDRLYVMFRAATFYPAIMYSDDWDSAGTATWSTPVEFFTGGTGERPYVKYASDGAGKLHFLASSGHPDAMTTGTCHLYHWYYDAADANFHTSNGTVIRSLASLSTTGKLTTSEVTKVYDATTDSAGNGNAWPWDLQLDGSGNPVGVFSAFESIDNNRYVYTRWTGSAWVLHDMLSSQGSLYGAGDTAEDQYAGGLCVDPTDTNVVYLANDTSGQWEIEKWETANGGTSWSTTALTTGSSEKNARPICPRGTDTGAPDVLWWRGQSGASNGGYTSFTSFRTDLWSYPDLVAPTYRSLTLSLSPSAYLPLDETTGTLAEDIASTNDGTHVNTPTLGATGMIAQGTAVTYNGTNQRTDLPDLSLGESSFTYVCFFKTTQNVADTMWVAESSTTDNDPFTTLGMTSGKVRGWLRNNSATGLISIDSGTTYNDGARHQAAFTCSTGGAGSSAVLYVDGVQRNAGSTASTTARTLNKTALAALVRAAIGNWAAVTLDEVALFNRVLTPSEVNALYEARDVELDRDVLPTSIASAGAVGTPSLKGVVAPSSIASAEQIGTPTLSQPGLHPTSIASAEALGTPTIAPHNTLLPSSVGSGETFGAPLVLSPRKVVPVGIPSADQPGSPSVSGVSVGRKLTIKLGSGHRGIPSAEAVGTPKLTPGTVKPTSIASTQAIGTLNIVIAQTIAPTSIASAEVVPAPSLARPDTVIPNAIASSEAIGTLQIVRAGTISPTGIASSEAVASPTLLTLSQTLQPTAIASAELVNAVTIVQAPAIMITPTGVPSATVFGNPIVSLGPNAPIAPPSIITRERFGLPRITLGQPAGPPPGYVPGRIANRLYDTETGVAFEWSINHSEEEPRSFERQYDAGAPTALGLVRQQSAAEPWRLTLRGTLLDPAQKTSLDTLYDHCDLNTLTYEDYSGEAYEVIITSWDCRPERVALNPFTHGLQLWRYTLELTILRVLHGAVATVIGEPPPVPPDITITAPPLDKTAFGGIASQMAFGTPVFTGGSIVIVPSAIRPTDWSSSPSISGGQPPGGPAAFGSRLRTQGTRIVDANGVQVSRMTGGSIHCLIGYVPSQAFLHDIKSRGASWVRVVCHWSEHESTQGQWNATARANLDTMLARCTAAELYMMLEIQLNVGQVPGWTSGVDETAKYANGGEFITRAFAQRYGTNPVVIGFGLNETPLGDSTIRNGNNAIPYLESVQRDMISWFRDSAPDWIGFPTFGYANQTPYPDAPRTPASPTAYDSVGGNVVIDVHHYLAGCNSSDPSFDGRQPNGTIWATYQGGLAIWQTQDHPISYSDTSVHRAQIAAYLADYVTFCNAAQIPLMVGEIGWAANNTGGKAAWWDAMMAALAGANPAMVAQWILTTATPPQEYWASTPAGTWEPGVLTLLASGA